ncbi:hypothetical protein [Neptunicoccus sediminis]|uniref:hypothetical protein n=1 Tax=Neptunicoccus sediminis TaxID=1892596 RepID=UPI0012FFC7E8|nr:hypothetical protein [Neptunicoccus sediminis]
MRFSLKGLMSATAVATMMASSASAGQPETGSAIVPVTASNAGFGAGLFGPPLDPRRITTPIPMF